MPTDSRVFAFVSTMGGEPWGGSEELWSQTALALVGRGHRVRASVHGWNPLHPRIQALAGAGIEIWPRQARLLRRRRVWRKLMTHRGAPWIWQADVEAFMSANPRPDLTIINDGANFPAHGVLECVAKVGPYSTLSHCNSSHWWPTDEQTDRLIPLMSGAERCYFVSQANLDLAESQLGVRLQNSAIARNPYNVTRDVAIEWPGSECLRMACVGRLDPRAKGQDLVLKALAGPPWSDRDWRLTFFGSGPMEDNIERLIELHGLAGRVRIGGHVDNIELIWSEHHLLVQPSRYEGLPLTIVEAMMCSRPVLATDVAGHCEVVEDGVTGFIAVAPTASSLAAALERVWQHRADLRQMGNAGAARIRRLVPSDPAQSFARELLEQAGA